MYIDDLEKYCSVDELADELQYYLDDNDEANIDDILSLHIYGTNVHFASFDADSILESATEELHEEAYERSSFIIKKLQNALDEIAEEIKGDTTTYFSDDKVGIQLTKENIEEFGLVFE